MDGLVQTAFRVMEIVNRVGARHDLSTTQVRLLGILRDHEPTMGELAQHLSLDKSSVSGLIDRAEQRGLVRRFTSPDDARSARVSMTDAGRRLAAIGEKHIDEDVAKLAETLTPTEQSQLSALLLRMLAT